MAEGVVKPSRTGYSPRSLAVTLEEVIIPRLRGVDLADAAAVREAYRWFDGNLGARALVDNACWAMRSAATGEPLWKQWGGKQEVDVLWIVTRQKPSLMAAEAADMCRRHGLRTLKLKGGQGLDTDLKVIAEVRAAVGPQVELSMDANRHYPQKGIGAYVRAIADAGVTVVEDPCDLRPDSAFEKLQRECAAPLLVDFPCTSKQDAELFLERGARSLMAKPGRVGISEAGDIDALCAQRGATVSLGMYYESALGAALSMQMAAALRSRPILPHEGSFFLMLTQQVAAGEVKDGRYRLPDEADLSRLVDWDAVKRFKL